MHKKDIINVLLQDSIVQLIRMIHSIINISDRLLQTCDKVFRSTPFLDGISCVVEERLGHVVTSWEKI